MSNLIVMLTENDQTVENAIDFFQSSADLPIEYWGFKNVGISHEKMIELIKILKKHKKNIVFEIVSYNEEEALEAVRFAKESCVDYLIGTILSSKILEELKGSELKYFPFIGKVYGAPSILAGTLDEFRKQLRYFEQLKLDGVDLLAYRYTHGDAFNLVETIVKEAKINVIVAGSIDSEQKIESILKLNPWGFTIGSALFKSRFLEREDFKSNLQRVIEIIEKNSN